MYKRIKKYIISKKGERGVAVLFALTFMALLLVMALSFAANSLLDQKVAYNNASASAADMVAESALNRIVSLAELYCPDTDDVMVSRDSAGSNDDLTGDDSYFQGITYNGEIVLPTTKKPDGSVNPDWTTYVNSKIKNDINWIYVKRLMTDGTTQQIFGRYAYAIIPEGLLTPSKLVKDTLTEYTYPELRFGNEINEINIRSLDTTYFDATRTPYFDYTGMTSSLMPGCANWISLQNILRTIPVSAYADQQAFRTWFIPNAAQEREAYWIDLNNDNIINPGVDVNGDGTIDSTGDVELFQRFNLTGTSSDVTASGYDPSTDTNNLWRYIRLNGVNNMYKFILLDSNGDGTRDLTPTYWQNNADDTAYSTATRIPGLLWLANFNDGVGTFANITDRRRQIAANLVDYCDTDSVATSDSTDWTTTLPNFTGNDKTRYINEFGAEATFLLTVTENTSNTNKWDAEVTMSAKFTTELINMYGLSAQTDLSLTVVGSITANIDFTGSNTAVLTIPLNGTYAIFNNVSPQSDTGTDRYATTSLSISTPVSDSDTGIPKGLLSNGTVQISSVQLSITSLVLKAGADHIDCAKINATTAYSTPFAVVDTGGLGGATSETHYVTFSFQADDPRQNLNAGDWSAVSAVLDAATTAAKAGTLGDTNSSVTASTTSTTDDAEAFDSLSTVYIRNAPMRSPWELGFIHRGAKWQTLNLKAYNTTLAIGPVSGGSTPYASGDANILDQIKMTDEPKSPVKVNIATSRTDVLQALFHNIKINTGLVIPPAPPVVYKSYPYPSGQSGEADIPGAVPTVTDANTIGLSGTAIAINPSGATGAEKLAIDVAGTTKNTSATAWKTRAAVANVSQLTNGTCGVTQASDATKEELIGKFINLTKVSLKCANDPSAFYAMGINSPDYFTVIIVAQTIKDIGGNITIRKNDGGTIRSRTVQYGTFDYDSTYDLYYDEIVSTRKLLARIYRDPFTGKCKIVSYSYLD